MGGKIKFEIAESNKDEGNRFTKPNLNLEKQHWSWLEAATKTFIGDSFE